MPSSERLCSESAFGILAATFAQDFVEADPSLSHSPASAISGTCHRHRSTVE
jgi:hypothetical protein